MEESLLLHREAWHRSARQSSSGESAWWVEEVSSRRVAIDPRPVDIAPDRIAADVHREIQIAVSRRWAHDPADQAVAALFTPFGRLDTDEQRAVIRTIHCSGGYGDQVWAAALRSATYRPQRSTG